MAIKSFLEKGCELQYDSRTAKEAVSKFEKSCELCAVKPGIWISCRACPIKVAHKAMMNGVFRQPVKEVVF